MRSQYTRSNWTRWALICAALVVGAAGSAARNEALGQTGPHAQARIPLADAAIFIEVNDTDGDAGIQIFLDGEGWDFMSVRDPSNDPITDIFTDGPVGNQGITELFFESAEPSFDEQPLEDLLALFPEGEYTFNGTTADGMPLTGSAPLTHALPPAPLLLLPLEGDTGIDPGDVVIQWMPNVGPPRLRAKTVGYEVVVTSLDKKPRSFSVEVGAKARSVTVPPEFTQRKTDYKVRVVAIEKRGNRMISEVTFRTQ